MRAIVKAAPDAGSNEWGISAALSASGLPMLANDPHLDLAVPSTFYPIHLRDGGIDVYGEGSPGLPASCTATIGSSPGDRRRTRWT